MVIIIGDLAIEDPKVCNGSNKGSRYKVSSLSHFGFSLPTKIIAGVNISSNMPLILLNNNGAVMQKNREQDFF